MTSQMLEQYSMMVKFLCHMLGPNYEVVLYDCGGKEQGAEGAQSVQNAKDARNAEKAQCEESARKAKKVQSAESARNAGNLKDAPTVAAIANGHITGRTPGDGLSHALEHIVNQELWRTQDWQQHFQEVSADGTMLRSSVLFLKDERGALQGLFCVSFDDRCYKDLTEKLFALCHPSEFSVLDISIGEAASSEPSPTRQEKGQAVVSAGLYTAVDEAIAAICRRTDVAPKELHKEERIRIIRLLSQGDFFLRKGAVSAAAEKLGCSKPSIYRYLSDLD